MSKVRVDQLSPTDDSVTINVKDLEVINELTLGEESLGSLQNIGQLIAERRKALTSNIIRVCTWNCAMYTVVNEVPSTDEYYVEQDRFNRNFSNQRYIRERVEWLLRLGIDVAAIQEFFGKMSSMKQWGNITDIGSNWRMYPYVDSFMALETQYKPGHQYAGKHPNTGGNLTLSTRPTSNGVSTLLTPGTTEDTIRSCGRVQIDVNGTPVVIYNTHLSVTEDSRIIQFDEIATLLKNETIPHIVLLGDWNTENDSDYSPLIDLGFTMANPKGTVGGYNGRPNAGQWYIDRILHKGFSAQGDVKAMYVPYELGDHRPVYCDLTL